MIDCTALQIRDFSTSCLAYSFSPVQRWCNVKPFCVCIYFRTYCWRPCYDLVEPVVGLWAASLSYCFSFVVFVSVSVSHTHTLHHTTHPHTLSLSVSVAFFFSRRNFPHKAANTRCGRETSHIKYPPATMECVKETPHIKKSEWADSQD